MSPEILSPSTGEPSDAGSTVPPQQDAILTEQVNINGVDTRIGINQDGVVQVVIPEGMDDESADKWTKDPKTQNHVNAIFAAQRRNEEAKQALSKAEAVLQEIKRREEALAARGSAPAPAQDFPKTLNSRLMEKLSVGSKDDLDLVRETDFDRYQEALFAISMEDAETRLHGRFQGTIEQMTLSQEISRDGNDPAQFNAWCSSKGAPANRAMYDLFKTQARHPSTTVQDFNRISDTQAKAPMFVRQGASIPTGGVDRLAKEMVDMVNGKGFSIK